jgi:hypothetical protein
MMWTKIWSKKAFLTTHTPPPSSKSPSCSLRLCSGHSTGLSASLLAFPLFVLHKQHSGRIEVSHGLPLLRTWSKTQVLRIFLVPFVICLSFHFYPWLLYSRHRSPPGVEGTAQGLDTIVLPQCLLDSSLLCPGVNSTPNCLPALIQTFLQPLSHPHYIFIYLIMVILSPLGRMAGSFLFLVVSFCFEQHLDRGSHINICSVKELINQ